MANRKRFFAFFFAVLIAVFAAGCDSGQTVTNPTGPATPDKQAAKPAAETMPVTVYYATKDAMYLVPEIHNVPKSDQPAQAAIEQLLKDPKSAELVRTLPEGTRLRGITVNNHIAYVDFNDKLITKGSGGTAGEILAVGSIVNTLTEFPEIYKVQIMVEGKKIDTLFGHLDTSEPLSRAKDIIRKPL